MTFEFYAFIVALIAFAAAFIWLDILQGKLVAAENTAKELSLSLFTVEGSLRDASSAGEQALVKLTAISSDISDLHRIIADLRTVKQSQPAKAGTYVARTWREAQSKINDGEPNINAA